MNSKPLLTEAELAAIAERAERATSGPLLPWRNRSDE